MDDTGQITQLATLATGAQDLESLVRPLLASLARATGLDSTVLTLHDRHDDTQVWRFVHNEGRVPVPEGLALPWAETLCQRMIVEERTVIADVGEELPDHPAFTLLGVRGFVSVPYSMVGRGGEIAGTLCGGSLDRVELSDEQTALFHLFATLIADRLAREIELGHERLRAEHAERRLEERTRFVASAEHALKSPLTVVSGWSHVLVERYHELDDAERLEAADRIQRGTQRLRDQIEDMLDEARTSVLSGDLRPAPLDIGPYLRDVAAEYDGASPGHDIVATAASGTALVDRRALDHVLGHLLENATKYAPAGTTIRLSAAPLAGRLHLWVDDEGPGLDASVDPFEPFARGTNHEASGVGLGLHIVRTLVESSGGTVSGATRDEGGARFEVQLPLPT